MKTKRLQQAHCPLRLANNPTQRTDAEQPDLTTELGAISEQIHQLSLKTRSKLRATSKKTPTTKLPQIDLKATTKLQGKQKATSEQVRSCNNPKTS